MTHNRATWNIYGRLPVPRYDEGVNRRDVDRGQVWGVPLPSQPGTQTPQPNRRMKVLKGRAGE